MNEPRTRRLIEQAIATFELDLTDLVILTEAASGSYVLTPMIAALAGAKKVLAITRDSRFGRAIDVQDMTSELAHQWGIEDRIDVLFSREDERISQADIVTNLGFVRPLDAPFLRRLKPTAVIPLMWETWEYRSEDLDLAECRRLGIPVLGTNEHHHDLRIFEFIGPIALKLLFALDIEGFRSHVVVVGGGEFADSVLATLRCIGAQVTSLDPATVGVFKSDVARHALEKADALVVVDHHSRKELIGPSGELGAEELCSLNSGLVIAHICGSVDRTALETIGFRCYPDRFASPGYMSVATDYVGPRPLIDLHTAGLRVGQVMAEATDQGMSGGAAEQWAATMSELAQRFPNSRNC